MKLYIYPPTPVSVTVPPIAYTDGGLSVPVTPTEPLPSGMYILKDGVAYPVEINTVDPTQTVMVPVVVSGLSGPINVTAGDLNVQLSDMGANFDATRIGDGSGVYLKIEADGSINSNNPGLILELQQLNTTQSDALIELQSINSKDFATETTLELLRLLLVSLDGKDFSTQATLNSLLTAFNSEDFATAGKQDLAKAVLDSILTAIGVTNAKDFATQTTLAALDAKFGTLGQKASAGSAPVVLSTEQQTILASLATKLDSLITSNAPKNFDSVSNYTTSNASVVAPAGTRGFIIQNSTNAASGLRFTPLGGGASPTVGFYLGVGQSTSYIESGGDLAIFDVEGTGIDAAITWFI